MFETIITPRVSETDGAGHINNTVIPIWFEAGRLELFRLFTPALDFDNWKLIIVNMNVDYLKQIYFGKDVTVRSWVTKIGNTSLVLHEELYQEEQVCAKSRVTYVNYNFQTQKPEPIPNTMRQELERHTNQPTTINE